jgi:2-keto-4-pentenoate hydratase/2-oxohepta-3-ene-1,7-dioic acid hydratase in catechol pathway
MKIISFDGNQIGISDGQFVWSAAGLLKDGVPWPPVSAVRLINEFDTLRDSLRGLLHTEPLGPLDSVRLEAPVPWPSKLIAYPANYVSHNDEMHTGNRADVNGFFLKSPSSIVGPHDAIVLPDISGAEVHHECELAIVIGKSGRAIPRGYGRDHIFGFSCLIDVTVRGQQERVMRKSFDSFCPLGPWVVTADEINDPGNLEMRLSVNGEVRQGANTKDLIVGIDEMVCMASSVMTLFPGDVIATGTPGGVGPLAAGDQVEIWIEDVGSMSVPVRKGSAVDNRAFANRVAGG